MLDVPKSTVVKLFSLEARFWAGEMMTQQLRSVSALVHWRCWVTPYYLELQLTIPV